ncbi:STAS domain-containing protein [Actinoplanes sp. NPDC049668]|uniref:STAS domain-containing protein n=1 Tax=unclassified Actinoplanes TaxID=2626549 RepID=UPI0033A26C86
MERPELSIAVQRAPDEVVFQLAGEIDVLTVANLTAMVNEVLVEPPARITLDMSGVTFCDSQGLGTLVVLSRKAQHARAVLSLANVGDFLLRVLDITGLRSALMISTPTAPAREAG